MVSGVWWLVLIGGGGVVPSLFLSLFFLKKVVDVCYIEYISKKSIQIKCMC
jgi:hypothetical protein